MAAYHLVDPERSASGFPLLMLASIRARVWRTTDYQVPFAFTGKIDKLTIALQP